MAKAALANDDTLMWHCPGCEGSHGVPVRGPKAWGWNESLDAPTLTPSVLVYSHPRYEEPDQPRCHTFIRDGQIQFLDDCTHKLAGQTVPMPDWED